MFSHVLLVGILLIFQKYYIIFFDIYTRYDKIVAVITLLSQFLFPTFNCVVLEEIFSYLSFTLYFLSWAWFVAKIACFATRKSRATREPVLTIFIIYILMPIIHLCREHPE